MVLHLDPPFHMKQNPTRGNPDILTLIHYEGHLTHIRRKNERTWERCFLLVVQQHNCNRHSRQGGIVTSKFTGVFVCVDEVNILLKPVPLVQLTSSSHTTSNERYFWMKMIHSYYAVRQGLARTVYMHTRCGYHTEYPKSPLVMY